MSSPLSALDEGAPHWLNSDPLTPRTFEITFHDPGVRAYVFTFG